MMREQEAIEAGGLGSGGAFTIAASVKAFEVLSSNLYQNKTLAVIREITCNAVDAHKVAGLPIHMIEVHLPTYVDPVFWVRDYGAGLEHDDVLSLYTTYFRSTKDQDNTQIGGFGLGSKSPFAVSDQFTVTSWYGGQKAVYVCYKQDGLPRVNHISTEPCGPETGIEVRVPLTAKSGNFGDWHVNAGKLFQWWPEAPTCNIDLFQFGIAPDVTRHDADYEVDDAPAWSLFDTLERGTTIIMGNVPYALDYASLPGLTNHLTSLLSTLRLAIRVPMGSVSISPSRETLSYDAATIRYLTARLPEVMREIQVTIEKGIAGLPTLADARRAVWGVNGLSRTGMLDSLRASLKLEWNGKLILEDVRMNMKSDFALGLQAKAFDYTRQSHWANFRREPYGDQNHVVGHRFPRYATVVRDLLWTSKVTAATYAKLKHAYPREMVSGKRHDVRLTVITGVPYQDLVDKCLELGIPEPINIDTALALPPTVAAVKTATAPKTKGYVFSDTDYGYDRTTTAIDLAGGGLYLEFANGEPPHNYREALRSLQAMGFLGVAVKPRIIGLSKAVLDKSKPLQATLALNGWVRFDPDWVAANVPERVIEEHYKTGAIVTWLSQMNGILRTKLDKITWKGFDPVLNIARPYLKQTFEYYKHAAAHHGLDTMLSAGQVKAKERGRGAGYQLAGEWKKFLDTHPMLHYVNFQTVPMATLDDYINR
jgi:hypothetical protein